MEAIFDIEQGFHEIEELPSSPPLLPLPLPPPKKTSRLSVILLDQGLFTVYKRLFVVCFSLNMTILLLAATNIYPHPTKHAPLISIANIFAVVICRSEAVLRLLYWLAVNLILGWWWVPLRLKTMATSLLQSLGGVHSGCGVSSIAWLAYAIGLAVKDGETPPEIIAVASAILALTCVTSLAAFPLVRLLHHNLFERTHRFAGWTALFLLWAFVSLQVSYNPQTRSYGCDKQAWRLFNSLEFWLTTGITILIVTPWLTLRRVPVRVSSPSGHAAIIKFDGGVEAGILGRISPSPFSEWHAFGIISDNKEEHMMVAGVAGDFTRSLVTNPPTHLWVRKVHFAGVPYLTSMYNRVLLVATGSGIAVFLSFLLQPCKAQVRLIWVTKGVEKNFGKEIMDWVSGSEKIIVHDTAVLGRPNMSEMTVEAAKEFGAEVVIVTSNPEGSRDMVNACKANGIAAFGPIWDS